MTNYNAIVTRSTPGWSIYVPEVDRHTYAAHLCEIEPMVRDLVRVMTDQPLDDISVKIQQESGSVWAHVECPCGESFNTPLKPGPGNDWVFDDPDGWQVFHGYVRCPAHTRYDPSGIDEFAPETSWSMREEHQ